MKRRIRLTESDLNRLISETVKRVLHEGDERFVPHLQKTYGRLQCEYESWQYAKYKPQGIDKVIDAIHNAKSCVKDMIDDLTHRVDSLPDWADPRY